MIVKMVKGAKSLTSNHINYLEKEHNVDLEIQHNKDVANFKKNPTDDLYQKMNTSKLSLDSRNRTIHTEKSEIKYSGKLKQELYHHGFNSMTDQEKKDCLQKVWNDRVNKYSDNMPINAVGHRHFILSPNPTDLDNLSNKSKIEVLERSTRDTMRKFSKNYIDKGDSLSYCFSVHTDKEHTHSHIYMHPITEKGKYISMNASRYLNKRQREITGKSEVTSLRKTPENKLKAYKVMANNSFQKELKKELNLSKSRDIGRVKSIAISFNKNRNLERGRGLGM